MTVSSMKATTCDLVGPKKKGPGSRPLTRRPATEIIGIIQYEAECVLAYLRVAAQCSESIVDAAYHNNPCNEKKPVS